MCFPGFAHLFPGVAGSRELIGARGGGEGVQGNGPVFTALNACWSLGCTTSPTKASATCFGLEAPDCRDG